MRRKLTFRDLGRYPLLVAAGFVAIGLAAVFVWPSDRTAHPAPAASLVHKPLLVLTASHALPAGSLLGANDLTTKRVARSISSGVVLSKTDIVGRVTSRHYAAGETISRDGLRDGATLGIAAHVPEGARAFAIRVAEDDIVGGFLQSGDHVDVFATIPGSVFPNKNAGDVPDRSRTVLLLQNIAVLAVGENPSTRGSIQAAARTVSLALSPTGLARVALAQRYGKVSLAIRMPGDDAVVQPVSAVLADLVPAVVVETPKSSSPPRHPRSFGIPFYAGTRRGALSFGGSR